MRFSEEKRWIIIKSLENSDYFDSDIQKLLTIEELVMFMDIYNWDKHYDTDITMEQYEKYFQPIIEKYNPKLAEHNRKRILGEI